ncbi:unnamed protein product [Closterium sp. NIES-65]|nr:unnamed protein product [Closterium sp. NIES-65]
MRKIPSSSLYVSRPTWWLESRFHFSFAEYFNPANQEFGVLRVLNDDLVQVPPTRLSPSFFITCPSAPQFAPCRGFCLEHSRLNSSAASISLSLCVVSPNHAGQPNAGFGTHPHRDMEIITYAVDGQLTHKDSMGTAETLGRGCVQYMSAGTGVTHSEMNNSGQLQRFIQIWVKPNARGLKPNYGSRTFSKGDRHNKLQQVVTSYDRYGSNKDAGSGIIPVNQDVNIFVSEMDGSLPGAAARSLEYTLQTGRQMYLLCIEGGLTVTSKESGIKEMLDARDALETRSPPPVAAAAACGAAAVSLT